VLVNDKFIINGYYAGLNNYPKVECILVASILAHEMQHVTQSTSNQKQDDEHHVWIYCYHQELIELFMAKLLSMNCLTQDATDFLSLELANILEMKKKYLLKSLC